MSCVVPVSSQPQIEKRYLTMPVETFATSSNVVVSSASFEPRIKQEILDTPPMPRVISVKSPHMIPLHHKLDLVKPLNDTIEYMPNDMDDGNIQGIAKKSFLSSLFRFKTVLFVSKLNISIFYFQW